MALVVVAFLASSVVAAPVTLTGNPMAADYDIVLTDDVGEPDLAAHLDLYQVFLASDPGDGPTDMFYIGLTVNDPDISTVGGPTSFLLETLADYLFIGDASVMHEVAVTLSAGSVAVAVDGTPLDPADFDAAVDSGLEVAIAKSALPNMAGVDVYDVLAQLDDTGAAADDQLLAFGIPEPATLGLLMLGGLAILKRRR